MMMESQSIFFQGRSGVAICWSVRMASTPRRGKSLFLLSPLTTQAMSGGEER